MFCVNRTETPKRHSVTVSINHRYIYIGINTNIYLIPNLMLFELATVAGVKL